MDGPVFVHFKVIVSFLAPFVAMLMAKHPKEFGSAPSTRVGNVYGENGRVVGEAAENSIQYP